MDKRLIDADKLLETLDAIGRNAKSVDMQELAKTLAAEVRNGTFNSDPIPLPTIKPGDKVKIINTADHRYINQEAIVKEIHPAPPGCAKLEGISRYFLISDLEVSHDA